MIPLSALRAVISEVVEARTNNLAMRQAVADHEKAEIALLSNAGSAPKTHQLVRSGGKGRRGAGPGGPVKRRDVAIKPLKPGNVPTVPRNIPNKIVWDVVKSRQQIVTSITVLTENNFSWSFNSNPQQSSWAALYDQWTIPQASVTFYSLEAPASTGNIAELHTALDFDNATALGSLALIDDFNSSQVDVLVFNKRVTRSVRPCCKPTIFGVANAGVQQSWIDSAAPTVQFFGIRSIFGVGAVTAVPITVEWTIWFAFRNAI